MTRVDLPTDDQIVRHVKPSLIQEDGTPDGSEFRLRSDEKELSVNWLEIFGQEMGIIRLTCQNPLTPPLV